MSAKIKTIICIIGIICGCGSGCGYRIGSLLPQDIKTVAVPVFVNSTAEPELETITTNGVIQEIIYDGTLKIEEEKNADTLLLGEIIDYRREPLRFSKEEVTREYRLLIAVKVTFIDLKRNETMWENPRIEGYTTFFVTTSLPESERRALPDAVKDLAHHIVEKIVEGGW